MSSTGVSSNQHAAARYARRLLRLAAHLRLVNAALAEWDAYDARRALPADRRPSAAAPAVSRAALRAQRALLARAIADWEQGWLRRN